VAVLSYIPSKKTTSRAGTCIKGQLRPKAENKRKIKISEQPIKASRRRHFACPAGVAVGGALYNKNKWWWGNIS